MVSHCTVVFALSLSSFAQVKVTEVLGGGKFYVQTVGDSRIVSIQNQLVSLGLTSQHLPLGTFVPKKGDMVLAQFSADNSWNRAMVCEPECAGLS